MKTILSAALVLGLCGLAGAQGEKADPVGTWKCEYKIGDQKRTADTDDQEGRGQARRDDELAGPEGRETQGREAEGRRR